MNKKIILFFAFILVLSVMIMGCQPTARCNKPYILVGTSCCLDQNNNSICDSDEKELKSTPSVEESQEQVFTINDLQADIGNVLGETVFLTKDQKLAHAQVYSNKIRKSKFLGTYGLDLFYYKPITQKPQIVIEITNPEFYLKDKEDFKSFVSENKNIFMETALNSKELFENEFKKGELLGIIYFINKEDKYAQERAKYINHSELSSTTFYDDIYYSETVSGNIAEVTYIRVNRYEVNVSDGIRLKTNPKPKYSQELSNINYGQSVIVQCSPNLLIALNIEDYGSQEKTYEKNYNRKNLTTEFFSTPITSYYNQLIKDAQALFKMCEQRYQFTYIRGR